MMPTYDEVNAHLKYIEALEAENARLREALEPLVMDEMDRLDASCTASEIGLTDNKNVVIVTDEELEAAASAVEAPDE